MPKSVFNGYLTEKCERCPFWADGTKGRLGCEIPVPIMECPYFRKMYEEEQKGGVKNDHEGETSDAQAD